MPMRRPTISDTREKNEKYLAMASLGSLKELLPELEEKYGDEFFVFIAPAYSEKVWNELGVKNDFILKRRHIPDTALAWRKDLDIFFVEHKRIDKGRSSASVIGFSKLSTGGPDGAR